MRKSRKELEQTLNKILQDVKYDRVKVENVKQSLSKNGILRGEVQKIIIGKTPVESLNAELLCLITISLYEITRMQSVSPFNYFTEDEIEKSKNYHVLVQKTKFPIVISNVIQTELNGYVAFESAKKLIELYNSNLLEYNHNITRQFKLVKNVAGDMMKVEDVNIHKMKSIAKSIVNNTHIVGNILINVDTESNLIYDKNSRSLILTSGSIDIINGIHEISALAHIVSKNPSFDRKIQLDIKNYSEEQMKAYFFKNIKLKGGVN